LFIIEALRATFFAALPVACFTFLTVQWLIASGRLPKFSDAKDLQAQYKKMRQETKEAKKKTKQIPRAERQEKQPFFHKKTGSDMLHGKLIFFGGGFYGTMALFTYLIIEVDEILTFFGKIIDISHWNFTFNIQFLVDLFINSIMNIVSAFIWFQTLPRYVEVNNGFIWIVAAYLGYLGGVQFTQIKGDQAWQFLSTELQSIKAKFTKK
jgi:hypothetical protein